MEEVQERHHDGPRQESSSCDTKSGPKVAQQRAKTDARYWKSKLKVRGKSGYFVRLQKDGRRIWFRLYTDNASVASEKARDLFLELRSKGIEAAEERFKPRPERRPDVQLTVGEFLGAVASLQLLSNLTLQNYIRSFRTLVSEACGVCGGRERFDYRGGGAKEWADRVDQVPLSKLTPESIEKWKAWRNRSGESGDAAARARRTCNSYIRCSKALFSKRILKRLSDELRPTSNPFVGVELFPSGDTRYRSCINLKKLVDDAKSQLKRHSPEAYKVFILALFAGLRRGEIDHLEWAMIDFDRGLVRIRETQFLRLKTAGSSDDILVDKEALQELKALGKPQAGQFVIAGEELSTSCKTIRSYRCAAVFDSLVQWLRSRGISSNKPIHELRKEVGAHIATNDGLYQASRFLRHSDVSTTARHYIDLKNKPRPGLGKLLKPA